MSKTRRLSPKQRAFLEALLVSETITQAQEQAGIAVSTAYRYLADEYFLSEYKARQDELISLVTARLSAIGGQALTTLETVMSNPRASDSARVSSARTVLEMIYKHKQLRDIEAQIEQLEEQAQQLEEENSKKGRSYPRTGARREALLQKS